MQEGSLRVDANINLHVNTPGGVVATPIVEVKNMNSFRAVEKAMEYEATRHYAVWLETGQKIGDVPKQTFGWDDVKEVTYPQRHKEESSDYRYFPDPDLCPVLMPAIKVEGVRSNLTELPAAIRNRLEQTYGITPYDSDVIVAQGRPTVDYFESVAAASGDGKKAANWVTQEVMRVLNENGWTLAQFPLSAKTLGELVKLVAGFSNPLVG